jgi:hypothetical protein
MAPRRASAEEGYKASGGAITEGHLREKECRRKCAKGRGTEEGNKHKDRNQLKVTKGRRARVLYLQPGAQATAGG